MGGSEGRSWRDVAGGDDALGEGRARFTSRISALRWRRGVERGLTAV